MPFPIQMASQLSGLSTHVIRIWERRYQALQPNRTGTNRRIYDEESVERLKLLRELTENGCRIGNIARLPDDDLRKMLDQTLRKPSYITSRSSSYSVDALPPLDTEADFVRQAIEAAKSYDSDRLRRLLQRSRQQFGQRGMIHHVLCSFIESVGREWQAGNLRPAHEHVATAVIREILMTPVPGSITAPSAPEVVITTPSGELHELGAMLVAASARDLGWNTTYLGPNLPIEEIAACVRARRAKALALSVVYPERDPTIMDKLRHIRQLLPENITIIVGGRASSGYRDVMPDLQVEWGHSLLDMDQILLRVAASHTH
jgi:MerR family transcriptional regulator, light-induced transcriptional regulator